MIPQTRDFKKYLPGHLANRRVRENIFRATRHSLQAREAVVAELPDWEERREAAHQIRREVIENLEGYLERFAENARRRGIEVLRAGDAAEARRLSAEIAQRHQVRRIVKSKSMISEEIGFNDHLLERGCEVVETDLGEYIIQLAGEAPSHLTAPALHKSKEEIARLFSERLGVPYSEDPQALTAAARQLLRKKFLGADMGVTGANFGIVDSGQIAVVENEGNARLCATLPPVHLALIGIERLLPRVEELALFLPLLCRSATGQRLTSFISLFDGPRRAKQFDGPEAVYYILVDNGRRRLLEDSRLRQALYCIRCGACYNTCPVYQNIGGHAYGWVYQGPIGAVIVPELLSLAEARDLPFASSLCGSCSEVCPVKIPLHQLLLYQRQRIVQAGLSSRGERAVFRGFAALARSAGRFARAGRWAGRLRRLLGGMLRLPGWSRSRNLPFFPHQSFREWWKQRGRNEG